MDDLLLKRLAQLKAQQTSTLDEDELDSAEPEGLGALGMSPIEEQSEDQIEETIQDPQAPEEVRRAAIQRVRQKYLQTR